MPWKPIQEQLTGVPITNVSGSYTGYATSYELTYNPVDATLAVFLNSGFQRQGVDYTIAGTTLTWTELIPTGDNVFVTYFYSDAQQPQSFSPTCQDHEAVAPSGFKPSTTLNHAVTSYDLLVKRIKRRLGWPAVRVEICDENIWENVNEAVEWYSKYAGWTEEYLMFDACRTYVKGYGIKMDDIINRLGIFYKDPCCTTTLDPRLTSQYIDCDMNDYRKVIDVFSVDPVEFTGTDTLFTMDYLFAQQTYFSYMLGSFGWDMVTWHILKDWLDMRKKLFATDPYIRFDPRSQLLKITPEPTGSKNFYGVIGCKIERSIADLVQERWVQRYALALTKISLAHIRGKFGGVTLFGGGSLNASDLMTQGLDEKNKLEDELMNQFGEVEPPFFFVG